MYRIRFKTRGDARPGRAGANLSFGRSARLSGISLTRAEGFNHGNLVVVPSIGNSSRNRLSSCSGRMVGQVLERRYRKAVQRGRPASVGFGAAHLHPFKVHPETLRIDVPIKLVDDEPSARIFRRHLVRAEPSKQECTVDDGQDRKGVRLLRIDDQHAIEQN